MTWRALVSWFALALGIAAVSAQTPVRDAAEPPPRPRGAAVLAGVVRDQDDAPVRRAIVTIAGDMQLNAMTVADDEGRFEFRDLPPGRFTLTAEKAGYPPMSWGARRPFRQGAGVLLQEGQAARDLALTLARGAAITGIVYDERGEPLQGVPIMAWEVRTALGGERTLDYAGSGPETVITDDRGMYRVFGLPPGEYTIGTSWYYHGLVSDVRIPTDAEIRAAFQAAGSYAAPVQQAAPPADSVRYNYTPVFTPGVVDPLSAAVVAVGPGDERGGIDLRMQLLPATRIEATIVTPDGGPVVARITMSRRGAVRALNTSSVAPSWQGSRYVSGSLSPGPYTLLAEVAARDGAPALWARADVVVSGAEPVPVTLTLQPALTATGRVMFDGAAPPPKDLSRVSLLMRSAESLMLGPRTTIDAGGELSITGLIPGRYIVSALVPAAATGGAAVWTLRSVTAGGRDVTDRPFDLPPGGLSDLTVTFTNRWSELSGALTTATGAPGTDYFIIAIPADREYWLSPQSTRRIVSARPDREGRYVFRGLPAGEYRLAVTTDLVPRDLLERSALEQLLEQSIAVTLAEGEQKRQDLRIGSGPSPLVHRLHPYDGPAFKPDWLPGMKPVPRGGR